MRMRLEQLAGGHGGPGVGFGFNSNGRYAAQGILRERFIPRLLEAAPADVANDEDTNLDPHKCWALMMAGEKPGGHGERSVACGVRDMALWDAGADAGTSASDAPEPRAARA